MFKRTIQTWNASSKERADILRLAKEIHADLMDVEKLKCLLQKSIIEHIEISKSGLIMVLTNEGNNIKMYINEDDCEEVPISILCSGNYEARESAMVNKVLQHYKEETNFVMFDVGANVGWYSLNVMKQIPQTKLYAFEPSPITYTRLVKNFLLNDFNSDVAFNIGLYKQTGKLDFYYDRVRAGASSLMNIQEKESIEKISVEMMKMDDWAKDNHIDKVDFIKCDVEGAELFVYEGGMELIKKSKPIIFSEMLRKWSAKFGYHPNDIIHLLSTIGYECFVIGETGNLKKFGLVDEETIETNYFFLHSEKHVKIIQDLC